MSVERAIILAAGRGQRLGEHLPEGIPKALLVLDGSTILERQVRALKAHGVKNIIVVVGYGRDQVMEHCAHLEEKHGVFFEFVYNPDYATTNTVYSLYLARHFLARDTFFMNGDVLFHPHILSMLVASPSYHALAVERKPCGEEEVKVTVDERMRITRIAKTIPPSEAFGEFIGVARFGGEDESFVASLEYVCEQEMKRNTFFEYAIDRVLDTGRFVGVEIRGLTAIEIDFPEDLERATRQVLPVVDEALSEMNA